LKITYFFRYYEHHVLILGNLTSFNKLLRLINKINFARFLMNLIQ
jgi:hypothetical protein